MSLEVIRARRVPLGLALVLLIVWLGAAIRRIDGDGRAAVLDSPAGLFAPRVVGPGWHFVPPGLASLSAYPVASATFAFDAGAGETTLVSREGLAIVARGAIRYRVDPGRVLDVHRELGPRLETGAVAPWVEQGLREAVAGADYGAISGARVEDLQRRVGLSLAERFRASGLELLACSIQEIRLREGRGSERSATRRVRGMQVLLIGLDGADWNVLDPLIAAGKVPNLARLAHEGVRGRLRSITPMLSPVIWTSVATGVLPGRHGIIDFVATTGREGERVPVTSSLRRVKAIWNILSENDVSVGVVGWWASFPAERVNGFVVSDHVAYQLFGARPARQQPRQGRVFPDDIDDLVLSLTVEPETLTERELSRYVRIDPDPEAIPPEELKLIEDLKTLVASGETYAGVGQALARRFAPDFMAFYLEGTDTVAHLFMPYAPPARDGTDAGTRARYGRAVDEYYRRADEMVGKLIEACSPVAVIVCSDHGFRTGDNRPLTDPRIGYGPAADWHRKYGMVILHGEPFRRGHELAEASVLDITPTILALFGLPIGEDMDGRPITDAFDVDFLRAHPIAYLRSHEGTTGLTAAGAGPPGGPAVTPAGADPGVDADRVEKLRALGYLGSDTANSHNNRGLLLLGEGQYDAAIAEFRQALAGKEDLPLAWLNIARAHLKKKEYDAARRAVDEITKRQPQSPEAQNILGNIAMERGLHAEAETLLRRALELSPNFTDAHNSLGILLDRTGRPQEALAAFGRVTAIDKDYAEAYNNAGAIYKKQGRLDEAIAAFRKAIAADPAFAGSYSNLALAYEDRGEFESSAAEFRKAIEREPENAAVRTNHGALLYRLGRLHEALDELERAVELAPDYAAAHNNLGAVYGRLGRMEEEIRAYRSAVSIDPGYADARHNLGLALLKHGDLVAGEKELRQALVIDARYTPACVNLARLLIGQGKAGEAAELLERGAGAAPGDADLQSLLGESYLRLGRKEEAIAAFRAALALRPEQSDLKRRIEALAGEGDAEAAPAREPEVPR